MGKSTSNALLDFASWQRAVSPTIRVIGYTAAIYAILVLIVLIPASYTSMQLYALMSNVVTIGAFIGFVLSIFKVLDEEKATERETIRLL